MIEDLLDDAKRRMDKSVDSTANEFNTIRTGRASAALLDRVKVDYYGTETPLNQLATINVPEPRLITVQVWDRSQVGAGRNTGGLNSSRALLTQVQYFTSACTCHEDLLIAWLRGDMVGLCPPRKGCQMMHSPVACAR